MDYKNCIDTLAQILFQSFISREDNDHAHDVADINDSQRNLVEHNLSISQQHIAYRAKARAESRQLLAWQLEITINDVLTGELSAKHFPSHSWQQLIDAARQRASGIPLQHIIGNVEFLGRIFTIGSGVFIPRPETELLGLWMIENINSQSTVLDICTGSGVLGISAALAGAQHVDAIDRDDSALSYARINARNLSAHVHWYHTDALQLAADKPGLADYDLIVCNPPYVPTTTIVDKEVHYDPYHAVFSGADGWDFLDALIPQLPHLLRPNAKVGIEHHASHNQRIMENLTRFGFRDIHTHNDLAHYPRFTTARWGTMR